MRFMTILSDDALSAHTGATPPSLAPAGSPPLPLPNAAQLWLSKNPNAKAQDILNWGYAHSQNTYAGAEKFLQQFSIDILQLVANRSAPASHFIANTLPAQPLNPDTPPASTPSASNLENRPGAPNPIPPNPMPPPCAAGQWLKKYPNAKAQDILNWGYENGGNSYPGAAKFLQQFSIDILQLVANRSAPASQFIPLL
ncbi:MAG: hypothetical protein FWD46_04835 [Cystobacterineae bacterium]|nr:hypothetical protein [Cystobacterineae bacterium]